MIGPTEFVPQTKAQPSGCVQPNARRCLEPLEHPPLLGGPSHLANFEYAPRTLSRPALHGLRPAQHVADQPFGLAVGRRTEARNGPSIAPSV